MSNNIPQSEGLDLDKMIEDENERVQFKQRVITFLNNEYRVMLKVRDFNYLTFSFEACGMDYPSISDIESEYYEIIEINQP